MKTTRHNTQSTIRNPQFLLALVLLAAALLFPAAAVADDTIVSVGTRSDVNDLLIDDVVGTGPTYTLELDDDPPAWLAVGDTLMDAAVPSKGPYLVTAINVNNRVIVRDYLGTQGAPAEGDASSSRAYSTIVAASSDMWTFAGSGDTYEIHLFNDALITESGVEFDDQILGTAGHLIITVPPGERHDGTAGTGARWQATADGAGITLGIPATTPKQTIEWLEIIGPPSISDRTDGIRINQSNPTSGTTLRNLIIHDYANGDDDITSGIRVVASNVDIINCLVYDISKGEDEEAEARGVTIASGAANCRVLNCTFDRCETTAIRTDHGGGGLARVANCAVFGSGDDPFNAGSGSWSADSGANCSDETVEANMPGGTNAGNIDSASATAQFVSRADGSEDYHLQTGADCTAKGTDLSAIVTDDIDGDPRFTPWDIGVDQGICPVLSTCNIGGTMFCIDLGADTDRDGVVDADLDDFGEDTWTNTRGAVVLYNCDDDPDSGVATNASHYWLDHDTKKWATNQWAGGHVIITYCPHATGVYPDGPHWLLRADIVSNTTTRLTTLGGVWYENGPSPPRAGDHYEVFDGLDAVTSWVDGPDDRDDMASLVVRPLGDLDTAEWSVRLRGTLNTDRIRVWADEDVNNNLLLDSGEDFNNNGVLDTAEDANGDGQLDPGEDVNGNGRLDQLGAVVIGIEGELTDPPPSPVLDRDITRLAEQGAILYVEALSFPDSANSPLDIGIQLELWKHTCTPPDCGTLQCSDAVRLRVAPWMMTTNLDPVQTIYVTKWPPDFRDRVWTAVQGTGLAKSDIVPVAGSGGAFEPYYSSFGQWVQDQFELGFQAMPKAGALQEYNSVVMNAPRVSAAIDTFAVDRLLGSDFGFVEPFDRNTPPWSCDDPYDPGPCSATDPNPNTNHVTTFDSFGNLEAAPPPATTANKDYDHGRNYYGGTWHLPQQWQGLRDEVTTFLDAQPVQAADSFDVQSLDTTWLYVGHVDEVVSIVPWPADPAVPYKILIASPAAAIAILESRPNAELIPETVPWWPEPPDAPTVGNALGDYKSFNLTCDGYMATVKQELADALGLSLPGDESRFVPIPVYFMKDHPYQRIDGPDHNHGIAGDEHAIPLIPDMVNLLCVDSPNANPPTWRLVVPDPFYAPFVEDPTDGFCAKVGNDPDPAKYSCPGPDLDPSGLEIRFIDTREAHGGEGEVHCVTNTRRIPSNWQWWDHTPTP